MALKKQTIYDVDGNLLHEGLAQSKKAYIQYLVSKGKSLARADLRAARDLSHLNLDNGEFQGANFDGVDLRGTTAKKAIFRGAKMRGVKASGFNGQRGNFAEVDFSRHPDTKVNTILNGAVFTYAKLDNSRLDYADFSDASMSSATMVGVHARKANFSRSTMHNVDWVHSEIVSSAFEGTIMRPTIRTGANHLPDRTRDAIIVGNNMNNAEIGVGNGRFDKDALMGSVAKNIIWSAITAGFFFATLQVPDVDLDYIKASIGDNSAAFVFVATAAVLFKERIEDFFKDGISDLVTGVNLKTRQIIADVVRGGKALASVAVAFVSPSHRKKVLECMTHPDKSVYSQFKATISGELEVLICDRKSLAEALSRLTDAQDNRFRRDSNIVIARKGFADDNAPNMLILNKDGTTEAFWKNSSGETAHMKWDKTGVAISRPQIGRWYGALDNRNEAIDKFMMMVVLDNNIPQFEIPTVTHTVREGQDGSIVVVKRSDGRLENPLGPMIITPNDEMLYQLTRQQSIKAEDEIISYPGM